MCSSWDTLHTHRWEHQVSESHKSQNWATNQETNQNCGEAGESPNLGKVQVRKSKENQCQEEPLAKELSCVEFWKDEINWWRSIWLPVNCGHIREKQNSSNHKHKVLHCSYQMSIFNYYFVFFFLFFFSFVVIGRERNDVERTGKAKIRRAKLLDVLKSTQLFWSTPRNSVYISGYLADPSYSLPLQLSSSSLLAQSIWLSQTQDIGMQPSTHLNSLGPQVTSVDSQPVTFRYCTHSWRRTGL